MNTDHASGNGRGVLTGAVISTDPDFRSRLAERFAAEGDMEVRLEVGEPFTSITDGHLEELRRAEPDLVFVDLESDPEVGLKFAQFLIDSSLARAVVGAGSADSPELLLRAMGAGILEFLPKPLDADRLGEVLDRLRRRTGKGGAVESRRERGRMLTVFAPKGGTGGTAVAVNLAVAIHQLARKRTLLVDLDVELGETALLLGREPRFSSVDLLDNYHRVDEGLLASYIDRHECGVELLSAPYRPADPHSLDADRLQKILGFLQEHYDYVVVDPPKALTPVLRTVLETSDRVYLLTTPELPSLRNVNRCLPLLSGGSDEVPEEWVRLVVNRYDPSLSITVGEIERTLGLPVHGTVANDYKRVMASINEGRPAVLDGKAGFAADVRSLAEEATGVRSPKKSRSRLLGGFLASLREGRG